MDAVQFLNGAVSGMFGVVISHPFDTIKTHLQKGSQPTYTFKALYKGVPITLMGVGVEKAFVFGFYENIKKVFARNGHDNDLICTATSGALSGFLACSIITPIERAKILAQTGNKLDIRQHPSHLFRGLSATFTREVPGFAVYFSSYEQMKKYYCNNINSDIPLYTSFTFGGLAGFLSWLAIYPSDMIKTRLQANTSVSTIGYFGTAKQIYENGGFSPFAFYKGLPFAVMRAIPLHAGAFFMMEVMKKYDLFGYLAKMCFAM